MSELDCLNTLKKKWNKGGGGLDNFGYKLKHHGVLDIQMFLQGVDNVPTYLRKWDNNISLRGLEWIVQGWNIVQGIGINCEGCWNIFIWITDPV